MTILHGCSLLVDQFQMRRWCLACSSRLARKEALLYEGREPRYPTFTDCVPLEMGATCRTPCARVFSLPCKWLQGFLQVTLLHWPMWHDLVLDAEHLQHLHTHRLQLPQRKAVRGSRGSRGSRSRSRGRGHRAGRPRERRGRDRGGGGRRLAPREGPQQRNQIRALHGAVGHPPVADAVALPRRAKETQRKPPVEGSSNLENTNGFSGCHMTSLRWRGSRQVRQLSIGGSSRARCPTQT